MNENRKYAIIIGAMKSGTTSFYDYLINHPEICPCNVKEPEYFSEKMTHGIKHVGNYEDLWNFDLNKHKVSLEASTGYTRYPKEIGVAKRIKDYGIEPYFIYIVRNPFDRIISHQNFMKRYVSYQQAATSDDVLMTSNYYIQLSEYAKFFPKDRFLILTFDEIKNQPEQSANKVFEFIELKNIKLGETLPKDNATFVPTKAEMNIKKSVIFKKVRAYIPENLSIFVKKILSNFSNKEPYIFTTEEQEFIHDSLYRDMKRLEKEWGVNVGEWGFK